MILGNYAEALAWAIRSLAFNQNFAPTYWILVAANLNWGGWTRRGAISPPF